MGLDVERHHNTLADESIEVGKAVHRAIAHLEEDMLREHARNLHQVFSVSPLHAGLAACARPLVHLL